MRVVVSVAVGGLTPDGQPDSLVLSERSTFVRVEDPNDYEGHALEIVKTTLEALDLVAEDTREQVRRVASQYVGSKWREVRERLDDDHPPHPGAG